MAKFFKITDKVFGRQYIFTGENEIAAWQKIPARHEIARYAFEEIEPPAYVSVTAYCRAQGVRVVIGGSDDFAKVEKFFAADWDQFDPHYTAPEMTDLFASFGEAIREIERPGHYFKR